MTLKITMKQALEIWEEEKIKTEGLGFHAADSLIRRMINGEDMPDRNRWIAHLADCPKCRNRWIDMIVDDASKQEFIDVAISKAANGGDKFIEPVTITTKSGKCKITIRKNLEKPDSGFVTLKVIDDSAVLEGRHIVVKDKNRKILVKGKISGGELSAHVECLSQIDIPSVTIIEEGKNHE